MKTPQKFYFTTKEEFYKKNQLAVSKDQKYKFSHIEQSVKYLCDNKITSYSPISEKFRQNNFSDATINDIIESFYQWVKSCKKTPENIPDISWLSIKAFKILPFSGKNVILNHIIHLYSNTFINFLNNNVKNTKD